MTDVQPKRLSTADTIRHYLLQAISVVGLAIFLTVGSYVYPTLGSDTRAWMVVGGAFLGVFVGSLAIISRMFASVEAAVKGPTLQVLMITSTAATGEMRMSVLHARIDRVSREIDAKRQTSLALMGALAVLLTIVASNPELLRKLSETNAIVLVGIAGAALTSTVLLVVVAVPWQRFSPTPPPGVSVDALEGQVAAEEQRSIALNSNLSIALTFGLMFSVVGIAMSILGILGAA